MSADIGPGTLVVCVDAQPHPAFPGCRGPKKIRQGAVYRVEATFPAYFGDIVATLAGVQSDLDTLSGGYSLWRFRKLNDGEDDAELIARIRSRRPIRAPEIAGRSGYAVGLSSFGSRPQAVAPLRASIPNAGGVR